MQFADVKNDIAFRKIFGNEQKKEILISFLNAILGLEKERKIADVQILNPYQVPIVLGAKSTVLDVKAKDETGKEYIVEMQVTDKIGFAQRVVYYSAKSYVSQLNANEEYYELKPVIFIGILNFVFLETPNYLSRHLILDTQTQEHKLKDLEFNFIELPKFNKQIHQLESLTEKWIFFIKNAENLEVIPENVDDKGLQNAYLEADKHLWSKKDLEAYEYARMRETDEKAEKMKAIEIGFQKGLQEGLEKGIEKNKIETALKAIQQGLDNQIIQVLTGLSIEEIEKLRSQLS
ncbi:MAG: Rpn family recombination-promoting nuclease/putative transposase [Raineya sp.]|nr:Rpn family recombination-promoting nuclease/putative transposase [Raineya sp.]